MRLELPLPRGSPVLLRRIVYRAALATAHLRYLLVPPVEPAPGGPSVEFLCNVCGQRNRHASLAKVENREAPSCYRCHSSLRMRSLMHLLSMELFGRPLPLPDFPRSRDITGLGMSDWEGYARLLAHKVRYTNTWFHASPRLDITDVPERMFGRYRFLISSDVFEHVPPEGLDAAFANARRLLAPDGFLLLTVPFHKTGETIEHFPRLHRFRIEEVDGKRVLHNVTREGDKESFSDLVFHGGDGMTLEMRDFSEPDLLRRLRAAGFRTAQVRGEPYPEFGILWPLDSPAPVVARC
jgi:SAM-dependent methyltransferase